MAGVVNMRVGAEEIIAAARRMKRREREAFLEDLLRRPLPSTLRVSAGRGGSTRRVE